ncbi:MAG TPA: methylmalonyl Co-A mutase-associated GTPase MeaB [Rhizomicrobium sp.]|jgi:LAO/AO transport system kinase|nr:methylmalonyl Co-A mutase-associated GTPase MeaB [Rhizomicrobium sp.]
MTERKVKDVGIEALRSGDRRALARAITLAESTKPADRADAESLLSAALPYAGKAMRLGISGAPGAGKSTFIEAFGSYLTGSGHKVAVLAIDPSSRRSGGSILGDKTRMEKLARDPKAFIRPSPAGTTLGGVARRTREAMLLAEAAGFDVVLVETVGVGQSETAVSEMVDVFTLLVNPGAGDDLQGIKRGVMELADLVLVTKSDGDLLQAANRAAADYHAALHLMRPKYPALPPQVLKVSSLRHEGIAEAWEAMRLLHKAMEKAGHLKKLREDQARRWFWSEVQSMLADEVSQSEKLENAARKLEASVVEGKSLPFSAARELFRHIFAA